MFVDKPEQYFYLYFFVACEKNIKQTCYDCLLELAYLSPTPTSSRKAVFPFFISYLINSKEFQTISSIKTLSNMYER